MRCPSLGELPAPPPGRSGWPWTEDSRRLPEPAPGGQPWPRITVVTPSYNQGQFIEETIRSVLLQGYPNLEYFVLDGGSTDGTVAVIEKYARWIDFWTSERDGGQSAAINRGLRMGTGSHAAWINSDDLLHQNALFEHCSSHPLSEDVIYVGDCINIDADGAVLFRHRARVHTFEDLVRMRTVWCADGYICQQEVLFPLALALRAGGLDEADHYSMDYELWGKLLLAGARLEYTGVPFGYFRRHPAQKTQFLQKQLDSTFDAATALLARDTSLAADVKQDILNDLDALRREYPSLLWRESGRLARMGLPPSIVNPVRQLKTKLGETMRRVLDTTG